MGRHFSAVHRQRGLTIVHVGTVSWRERLRYRFDKWMSRGTGAIMGLLGLATLAFVLVIAVVVGLVEAYPDPDNKSGFWDVAWGNLMRTLDPGTMGGDTGWGFRVLMLTVTIGGLVIVASLIGIVSGAFDDKMVELRKGRSRVLETDHTIILGWNNQLFTIISELCIANSSKGRSTIVVLADHDKIAMEDEIRAKVPHPGSTAIICRHGNPTSPNDVQLTSPTTARSIVVLPSEEDERPDMTVIRSVLALTQVSATGGPTVIAQLRDPSNLDAARVAGRERARWVLAGDLINRMTVQTCLQPGLSAVCTELLDFAGDEIYFARIPELENAAYLEAQLAFSDSTVIGISRGDSILLNPDASDFIEEGDELIVIAEDNSTIPHRRQGCRHRRDQWSGRCTRSPGKDSGAGVRLPCPGNDRGPCRLCGARVIRHRRGRHGPPRLDLPGRPAGRHETG